MTRRDAGALQESNMSPTSDTSETGQPSGRIENCACFLWICIKGPYGWNPFVCIPFNLCRIKYATNKKYTIWIKIFQRAVGYLWRLRLGLGRGLFCFVNLRIGILVIDCCQSHQIKQIIWLQFCWLFYLGKSCMLSSRQQVSMQSWVPLSNGINLDEIIRFSLCMFVCNNIMFLPADTPLVCIEMDNKAHFEVLLVLVLFFLVLLLFDSFLLRRPT